MMKGYQELAQKSVFRFDDAYKIFKNKATTYGALSRLEKQGLVKKVRNNLYVSINPATKVAFASKYQIGSMIHEDSYISHSSALEYYGYQNQVSHICYVSSTHRFNSFECDDIMYKHIQAKSSKGVVKPPYTERLNITDVEKTVIDSIQSIDSLISLEQLIYSLEIIPRLDELKIIEYLEEYDIQALYQKTGYLLSLFHDIFLFSNSFFKLIKTKIHKGVVYLSSDAKLEGSFQKEYQIVVPKWLEDRGKHHDI